MLVDHMHQPWRTLEAIKFVRIGEDYQEYGLPIPDVMLTDAIKQSVKKKTDSRRVVKKKVTLFADDNTISDDPDAALELAKSISRTDAKEEEATKKVHDTHARIVTESVLEGDEEDETDDVEKDDKDGDADDEGDDHVSDTQDADDEDVKTESDEDDIYKYKIPKERAEITSEAKDDTKKTELPPSSLSLSVSSGFGDQFLKLSSDSSLVGTVKDSADTDVIVSGSNTLIDVQLRVAKLEQDVFELKNVDHSSEVLVVLELHVPAVVDSYLDSKITKKPTPTTEQESEKSPPEILKIKKEQAEKQKTPKFTIKSTNKATLEEYDLKSALYQSMHANKSLNRNLANYKLYHAIMEALIKDENAMDKGVANTVKDYKRKHDDDDDDDDEGPSARPNQGSKTGKFASAQEPIEEPIAEVVMDEAGEDVPHDDDQPQDTSDPKTRKSPNP
ncbi:hypothetical protein Tco_1042150 [Tanacetum coccineum]|uniref:Uncharacterized protein n=1 Tax=Tanacetum coccineum TaxID=301880 RepID=A0ABQ5GI80_9ASTR